MTRKNQDGMLPEWSHKVFAEDVRLTPVRTTISASPQERKDLARRLQVESIDSLSAELILERDPGNMVLRVAGSLEAHLTQLCVVTLEPVPQEVHASVEGWYADPEQAVSLTMVRHERRGQQAGAELPMLEEEDAPEPLMDGFVDLGELVTQHLSLSMNLYPHKEGLVPGADMTEEGKKAGLAGKASEVRQNPFAGLKDWKENKNKGKRIK